MKNLVKNDVQVMSHPIVKIEEVSVENLGMSNNPDSSCPKVVEYGYKYLPVLGSKFPENLDPSKLTPVRFRPVFDVSLDLIEIHPTAQMTYVEKDLRSLKFVIDRMGQLEPAGAVKRGNRFQVFDGISRVLIAKELNWEKIRIELFDYDDSELGDIHVIKNMRTKRSQTEQVLKAESVLGILGKTQGKKREMIGDISLKDDQYGLAGKDRFQLTCAVLDLDFSASTLRKIIAVKEFEEAGNEEVKGLGLMDMIQNNGMTISNAFNLMKNYQKAVKERDEINPLIESLEAGINDRFQLFNKSSLDLSDLDDNSIQMAITSQAYWNMRTYPEGVSDLEIPFGHEEDVDDFVKNGVRFYRGIKRVLKEDGSLFINIGEAFRNGVSSLSTHKLVIGMVEDGWHLVQTIKWKKTNTKPQGRIKRLRPVTEEIFHFVKNPTSFKFKELVFWSNSENIAVTTGCNDETSGNKKSPIGKYSLKRPRFSLSDFIESQKVESIIEGTTFDWAKMRKIDPTFVHVAPAPDYLAIIPIMMTTDIGDTVLDIFCGSGTFLDTSITLGRNGVGYDTDPGSIEFSRKRLVRAIGEQIPNEELNRIESQYFLKAA